MNKKVGFIGVGNMGGAILCGAVSGGAVKAEDIYACSLEFSEKVKELNINVTNLQDLVVQADYIILCVKPLSMERVLKDIASVDGYLNKVYISIAAGVTIDYIKGILGDAKVIRTMPNLALLAGAGMTVIAPDSNVDGTDMEFAEKIFSSAGRTLRVEEKYINSCTAVSGSGPAYAFMFIEALADGAVREGIARKDAYVLAAQTLMGSALMQLETDMHPAVLKDMVCSPGGTTIDAVRSLENDGFRSAVMNAVDVCARKAESMKK